jgi:hypothetical protein
MLSTLTGHVHIAVNSRRFRWDGYYPAAGNSVTDSGVGLVTHRWFPTDAMLVGLSNA